MPLRLLQGSVPKPVAGPSGLYIPEPLHFDLAGDPALEAAGIQYHKPHAQPETQQPAHASSSHSAMQGSPDWVAPKAKSPETQHCAEESFRHPFRLLPATAFEQQPDADMLLEGYKSQADKQQQPENSPHLQQGSWGAQAAAVQGRLASMQQKPAWEAPQLQGRLDCISSA